MKRCCVSSVIQCMVAFSNHYWRWRLFYKSKLPEVQINLHFGYLNLLKIVSSTSRCRDLTVYICTHSGTKHCNNLKVLSLKSEIALIFALRCNRICLEFKETSINSKWTHPITRKQTMKTLHLHSLWFHTILGRLSRRRTDYGLGFKWFLWF